MRKSLAGSTVLIGLCVVLGACAGPSTSSPTTAPAAAPTTAPAAQTSAPAAEPTPAPAPTAVARPTQLAAAASSASTTTSGTRLTIDQSASQATYKAQETLAGRNLPSAAVGTSKTVTGTIVLGNDGAVDADQSKIDVDLTSLQSNENRRDNFIKGNTLQTSRYPRATFVPRAVQGLPSPLPTSGQAAFQLLGDLTVHGVTKPVTWQVTAQFADRQVTGTASADVKMSDFGMTPPRVGPVLSIEDALTLELAFSAAREA